MAVDGHLAGTVALLHGFSHVTQLEQGHALGHVQPLVVTGTCTVIYQLEPSVLHRSRQPNLFFGSGFYNLLR